MARKQSISLQEAAAMVGVPYPTICNWIQWGLVSPKSYGGQQGVPIKISLKELKELSILAQLRKVLSMQQLKKAIHYLKGLGHNPLSNGRFYAVVGGPAKKHELIKICNERTAIQLIGAGKGQLMLPLRFDETDSFKET